MPDGELRPETYATAATEHVTAARELHESARYVLAHYVAGLSVECILRAFKARLDPVLDERHDLRLLAKNGQFLDAAATSRTLSLMAALGEVIARWDNRHRYRSDAALRKFLTARALFAKKGDLLKISSRKIVNAAYELVSFGAKTWKS